MATRTLLILALAAVIGCSSGSPATSTPTRAPTATPMSTASPTAGPATASPPTARLLGPDDKGTTLTPGTYRIGAPFTRPFTFTLASAWSLEGLSEFDVQLHGGSYLGAPWLIVDVVDNVFADLCRTAGGPLTPAVPHSVDAVLDALTRVHAVSASAIDAVDIRGQPVKMVQLTNSVDTDTTVCTDDRLLNLWTLPGGQKGPGTNGGATENIWAFSVDGSVVLFDGETYVDTPSTDGSQIEPIASSLKFDY